MTPEVYDQQFEQFCRMCEESGIAIPNRDDRMPIYDDDRKSHDEKDFSLDYWAHCSWAARKLAEYKPIRHVDFGSYAYFAGIASAFVDDFVFADIRGLPQCGLTGLTCWISDMTCMKHFPDNSEESLSSLHVIEHLGLGRYGDRLNPVGDKWAANELSRILAPGGHLIVVLPMNEKPAVCFNAHRFYSLAQVRALFSGLAPVEFSYIYGDRICKGPVPESGHYTGLMVFSK